METAAIEASCIGPPRRVAGPVDALEIQRAGECRDEIGDSCRIHHEGTHPLRAEQPLLSRDCVGVGTQGIEADWDRAGSLGAVNDDEGLQAETLATAPVY